MLSFLICTVRTKTVVSVVRMCGEERIKAPLRAHVLMLRDAWVIPGG